MKKTVKAIYILIVALIVFTGVLLIAEGVKESHTAAPAAAASATPDPFDNQEGSAT